MKKTDQNVATTSTTTANATANAFNEYFNKSGDCLRVYADRSCELNGVPQKQKAQYRPNSTTACYIIVGGSTLSFSNKAQSGTTAVGVKVLKEYATADDFKQNDPACAKMVALRGTDLNTLIQPLNEKIAKIKNEIATITSDHAKVNAYTDDQFNGIITEMFNKHCEQVKKANISKNTKTDLVEMVASKDDEIAQLKAQLAMLMANK